MAASEPQPAILICGLGKLGQACLRRLQGFDVPLLALDRHAPDWRDPNLAHALQAPVVVGDMRRAHHLAQAGAANARAVLLLSSESTVNLEAALQVRLLNPSAQIVVRASGEQRQLGDLLEQRLARVTVVDPVALMRWAMLQALRPGDAAARFDADGQVLTVFQGVGQDRRFQRPLLLDQRSTGWLVAPLAFQGNVPSAGSPAAGPKRPAQHRLWLRPWTLRWPLQPHGRWLRLDRRQRRRALLLGSLVLVLLIAIAQLAAGSNWQQGVFVTLALLKGEFVDPVNVVLAGRPLNSNSDSWLVSGSLLLSLLGTLLTSALVAVILERLLSARFGLTVKPRLPRGVQPILLVGGDGLAQALSSELQREGHCVWAVDAQSAALEAVQRSLKERGVLAIGMLSADLLANVEGVLALQRCWPEARLAMVTTAEQAAEQLGELLGGVTVISSLSLAADVVVATAFGERVEGVWPIGEAMGLLVRYRIQPGDSLCGLSLARVQHGYGVTAIALKRPSRGDGLALPPVDLVLAPEDQLLILATLAGLRRIELGQLQPPSQRLRLRLRRPLPSGRLFEVHRNLARYLGCSVEAAHGLQLGEQWRELAVDPDIATLLVDNLGRLGLDLERVPEAKLE